MSRDDASEEWRVIPEFPDYAVSSLGRFRREQPDKRGRGVGRIIKIKFHEDNACSQIGLVRDGHQYRLMANRVVCAAFHGNGTGLLARHLDGDFHNLRADNLEWSTILEKAHSMVVRGTQPRGERSGPHTKPWTVRRGDDHWTRYMPEALCNGQNHAFAKMTEDDVRYIRACELTPQTLGEQYGVAPNTIRAIRKRKTWKHI